MRCNGIGGVAEAISIAAMAEAEIDGDFKVNFYRTNKRKMEGLCVCRTNIYIGISTQDFYRSGLSVLFHEIGHSYGLTHKKAIHYSYEILQVLSKRKFMHLDLAQMNFEATRHIMRRCQPELRPTSFPDHRVVSNNKATHSEVTGSYKDVIPYLDLRPDAKVFTMDRQPVTGRLVESTEGNFEAVVCIPFIMGD